MPRNQQSASNTSAQLSVRADADLKEQYKEALDAEGKSMSDDLREHMERVVAEHGGTTGRAEYLPADEELATAYLRLEALANLDRRTVSVDVATSELADTLNRPAKTIRPNVFRPLEQRGYIQPRYGLIYVATPDEVV